jgi:hypothetical protein
MPMLKRIRRAGQSAHVLKMENAKDCRISVGKPEGKKMLA